MGQVDPGDRREEEERKNECVEQWFRNRVVVLWWTEGEVLASV